MGRQESERAARAIAARILTLRRDGETDADFARRLGITPQLLHHYKRGGGASADVIARITRSEARAYWLLTGEDPPDGAGEGVAAVTGSSGSPAEERELFEQIRRIVEASDIAPAMRVLMLAEVRAAWSVAALYRGEVNAGLRSLSLARATGADEAPRAGAVADGDVVELSDEELRELSDSGRLRHPLRTLTITRAPRPEERAAARRTKGGKRPA